LNVAKQRSKKPTRDREQ